MEIKGQAEESLTIVEDSVTPISNACLYTFLWSKDHGVNAPHRPSLLKKLIIPISLWIHVTSLDSDIRPTSTHSTRLTSFLFRNLVAFSSNNQAFSYMPKTGWLVVLYS